MFYFKVLVSGLFVKVYMNKAVCMQKVHLWLHNIMRNFGRSEIELFTLIQIHSEVVLLLTWQKNSFNPTLPGLFSAVANLGGGWFHPPSR